jgi:hypothetical protein
LNDGSKSIEENKETVKELTHAQEELNKILGKVKAASIAFNDTVDQQAKHDVEGMTGAIYGLVDALKEANDGFDAAGAVAFENQKQMDATDELLENQQNAAKGTSQTWEQAFSEASNFAGQFYDTNRAMEERQSQYQTELLQQQLDAGIISQEEYDESLRGIQQERANAAKQSAMFNAIINTAQAVTSALSVNDYANAILFGVLGAAEIATISAQPIPQFATGTPNAPAGFKWVGEEGPELIYDGGGYPIITHEESMKILEKYHIPTVDIGRIESGGFEGLSESAKLNGFNDMNILHATDRLRASNKEGFVYMARELSKAMKGKRRGYA